MCALLVALLSECLSANFETHHVGIAARGGFLLNWLPEVNPTVTLHLLNLHLSTPPLSYNTTPFLKVEPVLPTIAAYFATRADRLLECRTYTKIFEFRDAADCLWRI